MKILWLYFLELKNVHDGRVAAEREVTGMTQMPCRRCRGDKTWDRKGRRQERLRRFCPGQQRTVVCIPKTGCGVPWALSSMHPGSHFLIKPRSAVLRPHELMPRVCISVLLLIFYLPFDFFHCLMSYLEVFDSKYLENFPDIFLLLIFLNFSMVRECPFSDFKYAETCFMVHYMFFLGECFVRTRGNCASCCWAEGANKCR